MLSGRRPRPSHVQDRKVVVGVVVHRASRPARCPSGSSRSCCPRPRRRGRWSPPGSGPATQPEPSIPSPQARAEHLHHARPARLDVRVTGDRGLAAAAPSPRARSPRDRVDVPEEVEDRPARRQDAVEGREDRRVLKWVADSPLAGPRARSAPRRRMPRRAAGPAHRAAARPATPSTRRTTTPRGSTRARTASATPSISTANAVPTSNPQTTVISGRIGGLAALREERRAQPSAQDRPENEPASGSALATSPRS